jgi:NAD-dependent dihydropyrimidine dehydrogenase PreA subunit
MGLSLENKNNLEEILPRNTFKTRVPQVEVERNIKLAPSRYRNEIAKYLIYRDEETCKMCGTCVKTCTKGVHVLKKG